MQTDGAERDTGVASRGTEAERPHRAGPLARTLEVLAWTAFFAFAAFFLTLRYWWLPDVERYRQDIVAAVSNSIGLPVKVASIDANWQGLRPRISLYDVRIFDREGREVLALPSVENVVSWRSLLFLDLRLHSLAIAGPKLTVRRDGSGAVYVAGMKLEHGAGGEGKFTDWILAQREIEIRDAEIEWLDEQRGAPPLKLGALQFRLRNRGDEHSFGLTANPPAALGSSLDLRAELIGRSATRLSAWNGRVYAELGYTDLAGWRAWVDYPMDLRAGQGAVRVWATLAGGELKRATADVSLSGAALRLREDLPVIEIAQVSGRLLGRTTARGYDLGGRNLTLSVAGGPVLQPSSFRVLWEREAEGAPERGAVEASLIELRPLTELAEYLPVPAEVHRELKDLAPTGELLDAKFEWTGPLSAAVQFNARARFVGLAMKPRGLVPGFAGLSGSVEATDRKGTLYLRASAAEIDLPKVFPEPRIALDTLNGQIEWRRTDASTVEVNLSSIAFANEDFAGSAFGSYKHVDAGPGVIDLSAQLSRADARHTGKYLPLGSIMGEDSRAWLSSAILAGQASDVQLRLKGDLREFPYVDPASGQFLVSAKISDGILQYAEGWPRIEKIEGELRFERDKIDIVGRRGRIRGVEIDNVRVSIPSVGAPQTEVLVTGYAEGPTSEFLAYIQESPVRRMIDGATDSISATGRGRLQLKLGLPVDDLAKSTVSGEYQLANNSVTVHSALPAVERAAGKVSFTESTLDLQSIRGQIFGGTVTVGGGIPRGGRLHIVARGDASARGLRRLAEGPWSEQIAGATSYVATVGDRGGRMRITVESSLRGIALSLPPPLAKTTNASLPLRLEVQPGGAAEGDRISMTLGRLAAAEIVLVDPPAAARRVVIALSPRPGHKVREPRAHGVLLYGSLPELDLDRWLPLIGGGGSKDSGRASFELELGRLDVYGKRLNEVSVRGDADAQGWSAKVRSVEIIGDLTYRSDGRGRLVARLAQFKVPDDYPGAESAAVSGDLPSVDLVAERFAFRDNQLGKAEIAAAQAEDGWRIEKFAVENADASLSGKGLWRTAAPEGRDATTGARTSLEFRIDAQDAGKFLARIGYPGLLKGGKASLYGALAWSGDPFPLHYPSLSGDLALQAEDGQFLKIEPGIGKLVSLMNLQMLPKRLTLNFSDVIEQGFQFDRITSSLRIKDGVIRTEDFKMLGSAAEVQMRGETDLARETQDMRVRVLPSVGGGASTVAGFLAGPVVGLGSLLAQKVLKDPLGQIFASEYSVTGTWSDPKVARISAAPAAESGVVPSSER